MSCLRSVVRSLAALLLLATSSFALPNQVAQEGMVLDADGLPMEGRHDVQVRIYPVAVGGAAVFDEVHAGVEFFEGYYFVAIGSIQPLSPSLFTRENLFVGITLDGGAELLPRVPLRKVPAAMVADIALSVAGPIDVDSVAIGGQAVIDGQGRWVGDPTGLRGPAGAAGPAGPAGDRGPEGPAGPGGANADPQEVVPLVIREMQANPGALPFIRKNANDSTNGTLTFDGGRIVMRSGGSANSLDLSNNNIIGVNNLRINDPGPNEGIMWDGTQAKIVVAGLADQNADGWLRLINDGGISLESTVRIAGDLSITGVISEVQRITATVADITTANIVNANITNLTGPNNRVNVNGALNLAADVIIGPQTNFQGVVRTGGVVSAGNIQGQNIAAAGSVTAAGHVTAGEAAGRTVAGGGGIWVRDIQVFDGNGNLLRRPIYQCPQGRLFFGTDAAGLPRCVNVTCPAGHYFRGFDAGLNPVCQQDGGLTALPANACPVGQALVSINAQGQTTCRALRADPQRCEEGHFVVGLEADGSVICAEAPVGGGGQAGQCAPNQVRPNILVCGNSSRDVRTFIPAGFNLNVVNSCDPNDQTQIMFVTRGGGGNAAGRAAAWRSYVQAGGQIATEYSVAHLVYNAVFAANVPRGPNRGGCRDNVAPAVKLNPNDPFWQAHNVPVIPVGESGCGFEVTAFPDITPLGGWAANQIHFGYRDLGDGRLWLVESDWQDNEASWRIESTRLMNGLVTWCMGEAGGDAPPPCPGQVYGGVCVVHVSPACVQQATATTYCQQRNARVINFEEFRTITQNGWVRPDAGYHTVAVNQYAVCGGGVGNVGVPGWGNLNHYNCGDTHSYCNRAIICVQDAAAGGGQPAFSFQGIRENVPNDQLVGWRECHRSPFGTTTNGLTALVNGPCQGEQVMIGCRQVGQANWRLLAQGRHAQVFRDVGNANNAVTRENGVDFYYSPSYSMGFVPAGAGVSRSSCDTMRNPGDTQRMCWHTSADRITSGYRCGNTFLNGNNSWERAIWVADGAAAGARWLSRGGQVVLPPDPRGFSGRNDINSSGWSDGGNDAFDGYGRVRLTHAGSVSGYLDMSIGSRNYNQNGYGFVLRSEWASNFNVWRIRVEPSVANDARPVTVELIGNLGSDGNTQHQNRTVNVHGRNVPYYMTTDGIVSDPPVRHIWVTSNPAQLGSVLYSRVGDNVTIRATNVTLPLTIYTAIHYGDYDQVTQAILQQDINPNAP